MKFFWDIIWNTLNKFAAFVGAIWVIIEIVGNFNPMAAIMDFPAA